MNAWSKILLVVFSLSTTFAVARSLDDQSYSTSNEPAYHFTSRESRMSFGVVGGLTTVSSNTGLATGNSSSRFNFTVALQPEFRGRYYGIELEGFYTNASFATGGYLPTDYTSFGANGAVKLQYPVVMDSFRFVPKIGIGYGYLSQTSSQGAAIAAAVATSSLGTTLNTHGAFALLGAELEIFDRLILWGDYAFSFFARSATSLGTPTAVSAYSPYGNNADASFDRLRLGAYFRVLPKFLLGAQYIRRSVGLGSGGATFGGTYSSSGALFYTPQNQYGLGVVFQF